MEYQTRNEMLMAALRRAHEAGDTESAQRLAGMGATVGSGATTEAASFLSRWTTLASAVTYAKVAGLVVKNAVKGAGSTITTLVGVDVADLTAGSTNIGIASSVLAGAGKYNLYVAGTAPNYFVGDITLGAGTAGVTSQLIINGGSTGTFGPALYGQSSGANEWLLASPRVAGDGAGVLGMAACVFGARPFQIWTNGVKRVTVDSAGKVGINIAAPTARLTAAYDCTGFGDSAGFRLQTANTDTGQLIFGGPSSALDAAFLQSFKEGTSTGARNFYLQPLGGGVVLGINGVTTTSTSGFPYIPSCAGIPTGTPVAISGYAPMCCDGTNGKLYVYLTGAWRAMN